ncbi:dual specificity protein phosphatase 13-like isoform X2 [Pyrgilauda ruficollis]|uniref:dual specificity protein phosphatase 13-like isoform X2 n=1 Tax=Pyrgilauda ruficollis TaxID=221976 RepID=UPI001B85E899|nr:dual specificity protein phosphatase 13-like isoform X2 [Pyrgilauda ruficollis]
MAWDSLCSRDLRRPRIRSASSWMPDSGSSTGTPSLEELRRLLCTRTHPTGHVDEVWPNLYVGDLYVARDKAQLSRMGISHIVNAAAGRFRINTGPKFYSDLPVDYYGVEAEDNPNFDLSIHFYPVAQYIREALNSPREKPGQQSAPSESITVLSKKKEEFVENQECCCNSSEQS